MLSSRLSQIEASVATALFANFAVETQGGDVRINTMLIGYQEKK